TRTDHKVVSAATWSIVTWAEWRIRIEIPRPSKPKPRLPHLFVLEALATLNPEVRRMFSEWAVYVGNRLIMMLRDHARNPQDNGVCLSFLKALIPRTQIFAKTYHRFALFRAWAAK